MVLMHYARKLVRPANDLYWVTICDCVNLGPEFIIATDGNGKIEVKPREHTHQFRRAALSSIDHVQNPPPGIGRRQWPVFNEICKFRTHWKSKYPDFFGRDAVAP